MSPVRPTVTVLRLRGEPEHYRLRETLTRAAHPHVWIDADSPAGEGLWLARAPEAALQVVPDGDAVVAGGLD